MSGLDPWSPPAEISADGPDPIFAAIEAHRSAAAAFEEARKLHDSSEERRPEARITIGEYREREFADRPNDRGGRTIETWPTGVVKPIFASNRTDLRAHAPKALVEASEVNAWIDERFAEIEAEQARIDADWFRTDAGKIELAYAAAYDTERDRMWDLIWTKPATVGGVAALLRHINGPYGAREIINDDEWQEAIEWTVECAVCALAGLPKPPMTEVVAELWNEAEEIAEA
jgi:hypothetical protein